MNELVFDVVGSLIAGGAIVAFGLLWIVQKARGRDQGQRELGAALWMQEEGEE